MKIRVKFAKRGYSQFLGHLDIMRYFQKVIKRAEIDIKYTGGYSPHQIMSFANPLGMGQTSEGEYMDIEVNSPGQMSSATMTEQMNRFSAEDIVVLDCVMLPDNAENAMASVAAARYRISLRENVSEEFAAKRVNIFEFPDKIRSFFELEQFVVEKQTKKNKVETDIRPLIYEWNLANDVLEVLVCAGSAVNLKPELVLTALHEYMGIEFISPIAYKVHRVDMYYRRNKAEADGEAEKLMSADFVSLLEAGEHFK